jgi:hypothetical protein
MGRKFFIIILILTICFQLSIRYTYPYTCLASKSSDVCTTEYVGVCGLYDPSKTQCIKSPCGITSSNACNACKIENVQTVILGECDKQGTVVNSDTNSNPSADNNPSTPMTTVCTPMLSITVCLPIYVCGFYRSNVTCDKTPCMKTYVSVCDACKNGYIEKVTDGNCVEESTNVKGNSGDAYIVNYFLILCFFLLI